MSVDWSKRTFPYSVFCILLFRLTVYSYGCRLRQAAFANCKLMWKKADIIFCRSIMATVCAGDTSMRIVYNIRVMSMVCSAYSLICGVKCYDNDNLRNRKWRNG